MCKRLVGNNAFVMEDHLGLLFQDVVGYFVQAKL